MLRMAKAYESEGQIENAYILYIKFVVLFVEKIPSHPEYKTLAPAIKQPNQIKLKEVLSISEKLKEKLRAQYQHEYEQFLKQKQKEQLISTRLKAHDIPEPTSHQPTAPPVVLDHVIYPNDFPELKPTGSLLLPDATTTVSKPEPPQVNRSLKPANFIEGELRTVVIPEMLMTRFLQIAQSNTNKNVETCGILAGKLQSNKLVITHCILPKQSGTSDSCATSNEEELFDLQDTLNLITIGWFFRFNFYL